MNQLFIQEGIPVVVSEFGCVDKNNPDDRQAWTQYFIKLAKENDITCVWWDNGNFSDKGERFGLINRYDYTVTYPKVVAELTK